MAVAFLSTDFTRFPNGTLVPGGCTYYRCCLPLVASGLKGSVGEMVFDGAMGFGVKSGTHAMFGYDTVVLKLYMNRWTAKQVEMAKATGQRILVDIDDHYDALPESNAAWHITHPEKNKRMNRDYYRDVIAAADTVTVSTPLLLEHHQKTHRDVRMVRNGVYPEMFHVKQQEKRPVIGWVGALAFRGNDVEILSEWLPGFLEEHDLLFHHSGHSDDGPSFGELVGIPEERMSYSYGVPMTMYPELLTYFDIGLVPLNDIPFNHAKSNIKGLEYAAAGIPFVASDLPEYRFLYSTGVGRVATTPGQWVEQVGALLPLAVRKREAAVNRKTVERLHSIHAREAEWNEVLSPS